jgi:hypothetical protein
VRARRPSPPVRSVVGFLPARRNGMRCVGGTHGLPPLRGKRRVHKPGETPSASRLGAHLPIVRPATAISCSPLFSAARTSLVRRKPRGNPADGSARSGTARSRTAAAPDR